MRQARQHQASFARWFMAAWSNFCSQSGLIDAPDQLLYHALPAVGAWRSLVAHFDRDEGVGGSNPLAPTTTYKRKPLLHRGARLSL